MSSVNVLALVPARAGSKSIPHKNIRQLGGKSLIRLAVDCAEAAGLWVDVYTDYDIDVMRHVGVVWTWRPPEVSQDDTPMVDTVKAWLHTKPQIGQDDIICLLQPTQPFRTPEHVKAAIALLDGSGADSVVSVVELPLTHSPDMACEVIGGRLRRWNQGFEGTLQVAQWPACRQDARRAFIRDGTVYAFRRSTVDKYQTIYGQDCRPLIIPPEQSCELDTEADWAAVEARWERQHAAQ